MYCIVLCCELCCELCCAVSCPVRLVIRLRMGWELVISRTSWIISFDPIHHRSISSSSFSSSLLPNPTRLHPWLSSYPLLHIPHHQPPLGQTPLIIIINQGVWLSLIMLWMARCMYISMCTSLSTHLDTRLESIHI